METIHCALCGAAEQEFLYQIPDLMLERMDVSATFVRCRICGLIFQNPRPTDQEMKSHYPAEYTPYHPLVSSTSRIHQWLENYGQKKRCRLVLQAKAGGALLDVGCANGVFLKAMQRYPGWSLSGLEINAEVAAAAHQQTGLPVYAGELEAAHFPTAAFDAITFWDVFEHIAQPGKVLTELNRILKPDGYLFFRLPNGNSRDVDMFGPHWIGWESPRHLYVYSPQTMTALLEKYGFTPTQISSGIGDYPNFVLSIRLRLTAQGVAREKRRQILRFLNALPVKMLCAPWFSLRSMGTKGSSLLITARKK